MLDWVVNNYFIVIIVAVFLIFALIGYIVDSTKNKNNESKNIHNNEENNQINAEENTANIDIPEA